MRVCIVGAGMAGSLFAILMARQGHDVVIYEKRNDIDSLILSEPGKRTPLDITTKGIDPLQKAKVWNKVLSFATHVHGRINYNFDGTLFEHKYSKKNVDNVVYSISRTRLHNLLLQELFKFTKVKLFFNKKVVNIDFVATKIILQDINTQAKTIEKADLFVDATGFASPIVKLMSQQHLFVVKTKLVGYEYKEIELPNKWLANLKKDRFYLWNSYLNDEVFIVQPSCNEDSLGTLILKNNRFNELSTVKTIEKMWAVNFPSLRHLLSCVVKSLLKYDHLAFYSKTVTPWYYKNIVVIGDAAHTMAPFLGQGVNAAFYDALKLSESLLYASLEKINDKVAEFYSSTKLDMDTIVKVSEKAYPAVLSSQIYYDALRFSSKPYTMV